MGPMRHVLKSFFWLLNDRARLCSTCRSGICQNSDVFLRSPEVSRLQLTRTHRAVSRASVHRRSPQSPGHFQTVAIHDRGVRKHTINRTVRLKFARVQNQHALAQIQNEIQIVRGDDLRARKLAKNLQQLPACSRIQVAGRFIQDQQGRLTGEYARQANAFSFAGTQLRRIARTVLGQSDRDQAAIDPGEDFRSRQSQIQRTECDIVANTRTKQLIVGILKQKSHLTADCSRATGFS